jgi:hypothetical protein
LFHFAIKFCSRITNSHKKISACGGQKTMKSSLAALASLAGIVEVSLQKRRLHRRLHRKCSSAAQIAYPLSTSTPVRILGESGGPAFEDRVKEQQKKEINSSSDTIYLKRSGFLMARDLNLFISGYTTPSHRLPLRCLVRQQNSLTTYSHP